MQAHLTLDVTAESEEIMATEFARYLKDRGWHVAPPHEHWEALGKFIERVGLRGHDAFYRRFDEWTKRGQSIPLLKKNKRLMGLLSNSSFDAYCKTT